MQETGFKDVEACVLRRHNSGPLQGNGADYRDVGREKVVGEGGTGPGESVGSDGGNRRGGGGGIDGWISGGSSRKPNHGEN